jgi:GAF domain-containing protein
MSDELEADVVLISGIPSIPRILEVVCRTTGMGFAAVARITEGRWIACGLRDEINFGMQLGCELPLIATLCRDVQQSGAPIVINHVDHSTRYAKHAAAGTYGFQSYISTPIILSDGHLWGTLCAIDPRPALLETPTIIGMFGLFAELIAFHLDRARQLASA